MKLIQHMFCRNGKDSLTLDWYECTPSNYRFYIETAHADFTREQLLSAIYALENGKDYKWTSTCKDCFSVGTLVAAKDAVILRLQNGKQSDEVVFVKDKVNSVFVGSIL